MTYPNLKPNDPCPKGCGSLVIRKEGMFALMNGWRGTGLVCEKCNALWEDPSGANGTIWEAVEKRAKEGRE